MLVTPSLGLTWGGWGSEPELEPRERLSTREFLLMIYKGDGAKMLNTTAASFSELRMKVLARWSCPPEQSRTISLRQSGHEPTVVESFAQLPSPEWCVASARRAGQGADRPSVE